MKDKDQAECKRCHEVFKTSDRVGFIRVEKDYWIAYHLDDCEPMTKEDDTARTS